MVRRQHVGEPIDTCMMDVRFREKIEDALAVVISDEERAGLDILTHGDYHCDEDWRAAVAPLPDPALGGVCRRRAAPGRDARAVVALRPARCSTRSTGLAVAPCDRQIEHRPLGYPKLWRMAQAKTRKPVRFGTCCSQAMALSSTSTPRNTRTSATRFGTWPSHGHGAARARHAGCRLIQIEEPTFHFMANTFGKNHEEVLFLIDAFNREVQGLDHCEPGSTRAGAIRTCSA